MDNVDNEECTPIVAETENVKSTDSAQNFQKFIYQLFEKNGILNDLRAYLRGHIVNVLKSAQTGDPPNCQRHFTQRLDLTYQALNILIAEYLMRLEFSYSLSVFVSEIPLSNMVFDFAKTLMQSTDDNAEIRFNDTDVWSILNYLGVQCDAEHASNVVQMYKSEDIPLILCILKCMPMYRQESNTNQLLNSSEETLSSAKSMDTLENKCSRSSRNLSFHDKCKHYAFCKTCQNRITRLNEKYKKKKKYLIKNTKLSKANPFNVETLMRNVRIMERSLIDEMFEQLKNVYEAEVEMLRAEEQKRLKHSFATHALQFQRRKDEMEESFRARAEELESNIQQKKRFLWGLARSLREQHSRLAGAMHELQAETSRLSEKEESLKSQIEEAEEILRKRGEEMRSQISNELSILEGHLESMKRERDNINRERIELEHLKSTRDASRVSNIESDDLHSHYDLLKNELGILRKYLESSRLGPKCVIERSTVTDLNDVTSRLSMVLNNRQDLEKRSDESDDRLKNQLINDLKKKKNVNFSQSNLDEIYRDRGRDRSRSSSSEAGDANTSAIDGRDCSCNKNYARDDDAVRTLVEENERLKTFSRQQRMHIDDLTSAQARLQAELAASRFRATGLASAALRPRTAPAVMPHAHYFVNNVNASASGNILNFGWRKGAGEELSVFSNAQPRVLVPGDRLPFIGVLRDRRPDTRRHLINQWRALRRRMSPPGGVSKRATSPQRDRNLHTLLRTCCASTSSSTPQTSRKPDPQTSQAQNDSVLFNICCSEKLKGRPNTAVASNSGRSRERSPKTVLREAQERLRNKDSVKDTPPVSTREKSPNAVLREAKLRLRKLEIEAEAVEKSYLDFRKKQSKMKVDKGNNLADEFIVSTDIITNLDVRRSRSLQKLDDTYKNEMHENYRAAEKSLMNDVDKYPREYHTTLNINGTCFRNRLTLQEKVKPIPQVYSSNDQDRHNREKLNENYLETPLSEFRKLYRSERDFQTDTQKSSEIILEVVNTSKNNGNSNDTIKSTSRKDTVRKAKRNKNAELEILKQNISKIYNLPNNIDSVEGTKEPTKVEDNLLRVEIEKNDIKTITQDVLVVVESCADAREQPLEQDNTTQMTIIVSPKPNISKDNVEILNSPKRSLSPEQAAHLTRNDVLDAIFNSDPNHISSIQMDLEISSKEVPEASVSDFEKGDNYPDDFSADVDNYNSHSDYDNNTHISLPKTSEDENFWDT